MKKLVALLAIGVIAFSSFTSKKEVAPSKAPSAVKMIYYYHCNRDPNLTGSITCTCSWSDAQSIANTMCSL